MTVTGLAPGRIRASGDPSSDKDRRLFGRGQRFGAICPRSGRWVGL